MRLSTQQLLLATMLRKKGLTTRVSVRWVEGWMRADRPTLDDLNVREFEELAETALGLTMASTALENERLADSVGVALAPTPIHHAA